jgi:hypothetical protein
MYLDKTLLALGALASFTLIPAPSQAACMMVSAGNNCATFTTSSPSAAIYNGFTDAQFVANYKITALSIFTSGLTAPNPFPLTGISYSFDGVTFTALPDVAINPTPGTTPNLLPGDVVAPGGVIGPNFTVKVTIPAGVEPVPAGAFDFFELRLLSNNITDTLPQAQTRLSTPAADVEVPGPLPILGAAAAFGYSRKLRSRVKQSLA